MISDIFTSNEVIVFLLAETVIYLLQITALYNVVIILKNWDFKKVDETQYLMEKRSYLVTLLILFSFFVKILIYPFFIYILDILSNIIPGAMCAAGVLTANDYGEGLFLLKSIIILLGASWLVINRLDISTKNFEFFKRKIYLYILIFVFFTVEIVMEILYLSNLSTRSLVTCCSILYDTNAGDALPFGMDTKALLIVFYSLFTILVIANIKRSLWISGVSSILFLIISYYAVIYFFGTYIYELPTHHCPFCMLQKDYNYIGYFLYLFLFAGFFFSFINMFLRILKIDKVLDRYYNFGNIFIVLFTFVSTAYVLGYYIRNGVFL